MLDTQFSMLVAGCS